VSPIKLFKSKEEREAERRIQVKSGRRKAERHIQNQKKLERQYWDMAVKAYRLADRELVLKLTALIRATRADIKRWDRNLLYYNMIETQRDQALAGAEFMKAFHAMAQSILVNARPEDFAAIQADMERSSLVADELEDRLADFQSMMDESLAEIQEEEPGEIKEIMSAVQREAEQAGESGLDADIEAQLKKLDAQLKGENS
jgi:hypothetical protein